MEDDVELDRNQWEVLKALGAPAPPDLSWRRETYRELAKSNLVTVQNGRPVITPKGRKRVVRGSPRLWDP
jgi:hypothetical protein